MRGQWAVFTERRRPSRQGYLLCGIAILAVTAVVGAPSPAEAAPTSIFWPDYYDYYEPAPRPRMAPPRVRKQVRHRAPKMDHVATDSRKPQGPLIVAISIERQSLKIYDANGLFAESPISTGTRDHPTPTGVFSVIEKQKFHTSNIYSGAPMPYMQRITWSGIAMHAGVLPGYPASHGCIRMPMSFAVNMWHWTRMGARVVITAGEITPSSLEHPVLIAQKQTPQPIATELQAGTPTAKSDKAVVAIATITPAIAKTSIELKSTIGHDLAKPSASEIPKLRGQTHTADASGAMSAANGSVIVSDATAAAKDAAPASENVAPLAREAPADSGVNAANASSAETKSAIKPESSNPVETPGEKITPEIAKTDSPDVKKDQAHTPDTEKVLPPKPASAAMPVPKRTGRIAVFVSRKDGKLYVRQNFVPLFDVPVTIAPSDRPLGTHVFTAQADKDDSNILRWSVVSLPARSAERRDDDRTSRRRKTNGTVELKPVPEPDTASEALDRLTIPADAMARITEALTTGGSIIVSDQSINTGETGEGTDFIIPLR